MCRHIRRVNVLVVLVKKKLVEWFARLIIDDKGMVLSFDEDATCFLCSTPKFVNCLSHW